jgi:hypothetical protein
MTKLAFKKNTTLQNILLDEYVDKACQIEVISMNFDGQGGALCRCDGKMQEIDLQTMRKIIFGISKKDFENYLCAIFDSNCSSDEINRSADGKIIFRLPELQKLKKYDTSNLAKRSLKSLQETTTDSLDYFTELRDGDQQTTCMTTALYGNTKSRVFHRSDCKSFNAISCTSLFDSHAEAIAANFKPCRMCKP